MKNFLSIKDVSNLDDLMTKAKLINKNIYKNNQLGKNKTIALLFFNPSLRTRLSIQKAALNLGMNVLPMNVSQGWGLEFEDGTVMNLDKAEHVKEAAAVISQYVDIIGIRTFAGLKNRDLDYQDQVIHQFKKYASIPIVNLESAVLHPLQSFTDLFTIESHRKKAKPKIVLSWAPHPKALPQAVANSFLEWMQKTEFNVVATHPKGYELDKKFTSDCTIEYDQKKAFEGADFIYAKNWSSYKSYGKIISKDLSWMITKEKMNLTNDAYFMHCLPVRRNVVVEDEVLDSKNSIVIEQAKNRVVTAQTILKELIS